MGKASVCVRNKIWSHLWIQVATGGPGTRPLPFRKEGAQLLNIKLPQGQLRSNGERQTQEKSTRWHDTATTVVDKMTGELDLTELTGSISWSPHPSEMKVNTDLCRVVTAKAIGSPKRDGWSSR